MKIANQQAFHAQLATLCALAEVAKLQNVDALPSDAFRDYVTKAKTLAQAQLSEMAAQLLGYAEGDRIKGAFSFKFAQARVDEFFVGDGHLWVRVTSLKKDGTVGKMTATFPASTGGIVKLA